MKIMIAIGAGVLILALGIVIGVTVVLLRIGKAIDRHFG